VHKETKIKINEMFNECSYLCKLVFLRVLLVPRTLSSATAVHPRVPMGILDLENVGAGLGTRLITWFCMPTILAMADYCYFRQWKKYSWQWKYPRIKYHCGIDQPITGDIPIISNESGWFNLEWGDLCDTLFRGSYPIYKQLWAESQSPK